MRKIIHVSPLLALLVLAACQTVQGAGRDLHLQDSDGTQLVMDADGRPIGRLSGHRR